MIRATLPAAALLAAALLTPPHSLRAQEQPEYNRCIGADGIAIYTDRKCAEVGAVERLPREQADTMRQRAYRGGCARSVNALIHEMTAAIDAGDVNRLAALYHWPGMSGQAGNQLMDRLAQVTRHRVVDIVPLRPDRRVAQSKRTGIHGTYASTFPAATTASRPARSASPRTPPVALRVQQISAFDGRTAGTVFNLRQHADCWWVSL